MREDACVRQKPGGRNEASREVRKRAKEDCRGEGPRLQATRDGLLERGGPGKDIGRKGETTMENRIKQTKRRSYVGKRVT